MVKAQLRNWSLCFVHSLLLLPSLREQTPGPLARGRHLDGMGSKGPKNYIYLFFLPPPQFQRVSKCWCSPRPELCQDVQTMVPLAREGTTKGAFLWLIQLFLALLKEPIE